MGIHPNELCKLFHLPLCFRVLGGSDILIIPTQTTGLSCLPTVQRNTGKHFRIHDTCRWLK